MSSAACEIFLENKNGVMTAALCREKKLWHIACAETAQKINPRIGGIYACRVIKRMGPHHAMVDLGPHGQGFLESTPKQAAEGRMVLAQIRREGWGDKNPTLTIDIVLRDRYLTYHPARAPEPVKTANKKMQALYENLAEHSWRGKIQTPALQLNPDIIFSRAQNQIAQWQELQKKLSAAQAPCLLQDGEDPIQRLLHDTDLPKAIVIQDPIQHRQFQDLYLQTMPDLEPQVQISGRTQPPVLHTYDILDQWNAALQTAQNLPHGITLHFEATKGLNVIDVDYTGTGFSDFTQANQSIVNEVARLIALKNLGGMIVIDFLRMKKSSERAVIHRMLQQAVKYDMASPSLMGFTAGGLFEMTRPRRGGILQPPV